MNIGTALQDPALLRRLLRHELSRVPACFLSGAHRPDLTSAASEKRRQVAGGMNGPEGTEVP